VWEGLEVLHVVDELGKAVRDAKPSACGMNRSCSAAA
jgi:hypothetical protein